MSDYHTNALNEALDRLGGSPFLSAAVAQLTAEADAIKGRKSGEIETVLGYPGRSEMIHRDDMVLRKK